MAKKPKKSGRQNYDWTSIKADYVSDPTASLRSISKKYGVSMTAIAKKSKADNWFATRKETQNRIATKAITENVNKIAAELSDEADLLALMKGHAERKDQYIAEVMKGIRIAHEYNPQIMSMDYRIMFINRIEI